MTFQRQTAALRSHLAIVPGADRLRELLPDVDFGEELVGAIIDEASRFSAEVLAPFNPQGDRLGCTLENGRVRTAAGHQQAWQAFVDGGWPTLGFPAEHDGQGMPLLVENACEELFNRGSSAFMMLPTAMRCAGRLLLRHGSEALQQEWLGPLARGEWGATICISEPDAGSDLARVRTMAEPKVGNYWAVSGEKIWISFGDHDLADRIGHVVLARTPDAPAGSRGLSLFLVPTTIDDIHNRIVTRRIEEKLGLHASPTCALGFEGSTGYLIGELHRGLPQLFAMITAMRLAVGSQAVGLATQAVETALAYAAERKQGGPADAPPLAISSHADVQRQLLAMAARTEVMRGLVLACSVLADLAELETDETAKGRAAALLGWLLPITKNEGAETAFAVASDAIQVLGGAGYTKEWPVEQILRDARVLAIYEGTSGMQALDLLHRRLWRDDEAGLHAFVRSARGDVAKAGSTAAAEALSAVIDQLEVASGWLGQWHETPRRAEAGAYHYLTLASLAATGWIALRLAGIAGTSPTEQRLAACGRYWLRELPGRAALEAQRATQGDAGLAEFLYLAAD